MFSRIWVINLVLAGLVVLFGVKTYELWSEGEIIAAETKTDERTPAVPGKRIPKRDIPSESEYEPVASKDLFSPKRQEEIPEETEPAEQPQVRERGNQTRNKVFLNGVVRMDNYQSALVSSPVKKPGEKSERWVRVGDDVEGLRVAGIEKDRIILEGGGLKEVVLLYDRDKPRSAEPAKSPEAPTVVSVTPGTGTKHEAATAGPGTAVKPVRRDRVEEKVAKERPIDRRARRDLKSRTPQKPSESAPSSSESSGGQTAGGTSPRGVQDLRNIFQQLTNRYQ